MDPLKKNVRQWMFWISSHAVSDGYGAMAMIHNGVQKGWEKE